jgi:organic radical activating enzyme
MLPIHERFYSFQGEGVHLGRPAFFIRTFGCPLKCPWCDAAGTWHPKYIPDKIERISEEQLVKEAGETCCDFIVITGGEPIVHDLHLLVDLMHASNQSVHLETSGYRMFPDIFDWVTLSPKRQNIPPPQSIALADELKLIIEQPSDVEWWLDTLRDQLGGNLDPNVPIWLHPEWSRRNDKALLDGMVRWALSGSANLRVGWQLHKLYAADFLDNRTKPPVPLGGDLKKGY